MGISEMGQIITVVCEMGVCEMGVGDREYAKWE